MEHTYSYHNLCTEIDILEIRAEELEREVKRIQKKMSPSPTIRLVANYDGMPHAGLAPIQFPKLYDQLQTIYEELHDIYDTLELKCEYKVRMESKMGELEGIEYQVAYERDVNRKPLSQIAKEMQYSYDWIRKISARVKRVRTA